MAAVSDRDTSTVSVMAGTQIIKSEYLLNVAGYYIHQDPAAILFVQPTQGSAGDFSKERFAPTVEVTPVLRELVATPRSRDSEATITHRAYPGGSLDFVGANSPTDLASRPKRIILCDEIDKYPPSAGSEGDPLKLAEERASTYKALGRAKFVRTCSPTDEGADPKNPVSRIAREYLASDQRKCFLTCPHCSRDQVLTWAHVRWDRDARGNHLPETAAMACEGCGVIWSERERVAMLDAIEQAPGFGWRQTREFFCCGENQTPVLWNEHGRSICPKCEQPAPYAGHAGFHVSKLYSKRHRIGEIVREFLEARGDYESLRKWTNTALAELWKPQHSETFNSNKLLARAEPYGPDDLPEEVRVVTGFCDVQGDRLEVLLVGWGADEECWLFKYVIIHQDPAQPQAWRELDSLLGGLFRTVTGRPLRIAAFGIDMGGNHTAQVLSFCRARRGRRIFACKGFAGAKPIWPGRASQSQSKDPFFAIGVDTAKDAIYSRLNIDPPEPGFRKPGFIHFPVAENFNLEFYEQLNAERRQQRVSRGIPYVVWVQIRPRNEALDCFCGSLAMRKSLPRVIEAGLEYSVARADSTVEQPSPSPAREPRETGELHSKFVEGGGGFTPRRPGWVGARRDWFSK